MPPSVHSRPHRTRTIWPATTSTMRVGEGAGPLELVAGDDHRRPGADRLAEQASSSSRPSASRPACGSSSSHSSARRATRQASAVRRRWPADSLPTGTSRKPAVDARAARSPRRPPRREAPTVAPQKLDVLGDGEIAVETVAVPEQADPRADRVAVAWRGRARAHDPVAAGEREQPGAQPQQRRLAGPVRALQEHDLARGRPRSVAPASAGKPPSTATASSSTTTGSVEVGGVGVSMTDSTRYGRFGARDCRGAASIAGSVDAVDASSVAGRWRRRRRRRTTGTAPGPTPEARSTRRHRTRGWSKWTGRRRPHDWRFFVGGLGKVLIATGLLMFGFVAYQLWGTGIETARAQNKLGERVRASCSPGTTPRRRRPPRPSHRRRHAVSDGTASTPVGHRSAATGRRARRHRARPTAPAAVEQEHPADQRGRGDRQARDPHDRQVDGDRRGRRSRDRPQEGPGPLPRDAAARPARQRRDRRPPHDLRRAVLQHRRARSRATRSSSRSPTGASCTRCIGRDLSPDDYYVVTTTDPTVAELTLTSCHPRWTTRATHRHHERTRSGTVRPGRRGRSSTTAGRSSRPPTAAPEAVAPIEASTDRADHGRTRPDDSIVESVPVTDDRHSADATTVHRPADPDSLDAGIADAFAEGWFSDPTANAQVALWGIILALIGLGVVPDQPKGQAGLGRRPGRHRPVRDRFVLLLPERQPPAAAEPLTLWRAHHDEASAIDSARRRRCSERAAHRMRRRLRPRLDNQAGGIRDRTGVRHKPDLIRTIRCRSD